MSEIKQIAIYLLANIQLYYNAIFIKKHEMPQSSLSVTELLLIVISH